MTDAPCSILIVEDEAILAMILEDALSEQGYRVTVAEDGMAAWELLETGDGCFDAILLDREMPRMNGMELLRRLKSGSRYNHVPVIIETASGDEKSVREGLENGAYYYLTKPYKPELMLSVVKAAVQQLHDYRKMQGEVKHTEGLFGCMEEGKFRFRTLDEGRMLANFFARACPEPEKTVMGLQELMINAVEHGNLAITYADKTRMLLEDAWQDEVERRLALPEYRDRRVEVVFERAADAIRLTIRDEGDGFDWRKYLEFDPERAFDPHGRGIAMACKLSLDGVEYMGNGNTVKVTVIDHRPASASVGREARIS